MLNPRQVSGYESEIRLDSQGFAGARSIGSYRKLELKLIELKCLIHGTNAKQSCPNARNHRLTKKLPRRLRLIHKI
jgi:hypothetical protein